MQNALSLLDAARSESCVASRFSDTMMIMEGKQAVSPCCSLVGNNTLPRARCAEVRRKRIGRAGRAARLSTRASCAPRTSRASDLNKLRADRFSDGLSNPVFPPNAPGRSRSTQGIEGTVTAHASRALSGNGFRDSWSTRDDPVPDLSGRKTADAAASGAPP